MMRARKTDGFGAVGKGQDYKRLVCDLDRGIPSRPSSKTAPRRAWRATTGSSRPRSWGLFGPSPGMCGSRTSLATAACVPDAAQKIVLDR